ncbi:MAG: Mur ligase family protein [Candidatus Methanomethylicia archaeon]|nr:Mur ligase family protein [Candidatus Methanomethylicia archaeon]
MVVDATHGGIIISEEFRSRGDEVTCIDVHRTMKKEDLEKYSKNFQVERNIPNPSQYDLIVKPVHFPSEPFQGYEERLITHHQAVKMLVSDMIKFPVVEITGSFGKTTSVMCAISLLRKKFSILSLTSNGICFYRDENSETLAENISTTPANVIRAVRLSPEEPDLAIFEVSLGGTGIADLGIIKNVYDDYPIAKGASSALKAKMSMITERKMGSTVIVNADDEKLSGLVEVQRFSPSGKSSEVRALDAKVCFKGIEFTAIFSGFRSLAGRISGARQVKSTVGPIGRQHVENMLVGVAIASYFFWDESDAEFCLENFGRKMVLESMEPPRVLNKSPSISPKSIEVSIRDYLEIFPPARLEVGGKLKTSCGSVSPEKVAEIIQASPFEEVALFGEFGEAIKKFIKRKRTTEACPAVATSALVLERG